MEFEQWIFTKIDITGNLKMAKHGNETNKEFQERTFPARIRAVKTKTAKVLDVFSSASLEERGRAFKAVKAADRVAVRMGLVKAGVQKKGTAQTVSRPDKGKSGSEKRREVFEGATGTGAIRRRLEGVSDLAKAAGR